MAVRVVEIRGLYLEFPQNGCNVLDLRARVSVSSRGMTSLQAHLFGECDISAISPGNFGYVCAPFPLAHAHPLARATGKVAEERTPTFQAVSLARDSDEVGRVADIPAGLRSRNVWDSVFFAMF